MGVHLEELNKIEHPIVIALPTYPYQIIWTNDAHCNLTGYARSEFIGKTAAFLHGPNTNKYTVEKIRHALYNAEPFVGVILNYRKDGTEFWNNLSIYPVKLDEILICFVGMPNDITGVIDESQQINTSIVASVHSLLSQLNIDVEKRGLALMNAAGGHVEEVLVSRVERAKTDFTSARAELLDKMEEFMKETEEKFVPCKETSHKK